MEIGFETVAEDRQEVTEKGEKGKDEEEEGGDREGKGIGIRIGELCHRLVRYLSQSQVDPLWLPRVPCTKGNTVRTVYRITRKYTTSIGVLQ